MSFGSLIPPAAELETQVDWYTDFYYPFLRRWSERILSVASKETMLFVEPIPNEVIFQLVVEHGD